MLLLGCEKNEGTNVLILTQTEYTIPAIGETINVEITPNVNCNVLIPSAAQSWVTQSGSDRADRIVLEVAPNSEKTPRETQITIKDKNSDLSQTLTISQTEARTYDGDVLLRSEKEVIKFYNEGYASVNGNLFIQSELQTLPKLGNILKEVNGDLNILSGSLRSLDGLYGLERVTGILSIYCREMTTLEGLNKLKSLGGLWISEYVSFEKGINISSKLESFEGLENLETIEGSFGVGDLESLKSFKGLNNLKSIGGNFAIRGLCGYHYDFTQSPHDSTITTTNALGSLESFEGLESLETIGGDFGFYTQISAQAEKAIYCGKSLKSFKGLNNLKSIGGNFYIAVKIFDNTVSGYALNSLKSFEGLDNLKSIGGDFRFEIWVKSFSPNTYTSSALKGLESLKGLDNLETIGGDFYISADGYCLNSLESLKGLDNLETIGGNFTMKGDYYGDHQRFKSFEGLGNLKSIQGGDITITNWKNLTDFCPLTPLVETMTGEWYVRNCGWNPSKEIVLDGYCSRDKFWAR